MLQAFVNSLHAFIVKKVLNKGKVLVAVEGSEYIFDTLKVCDVVLKKFHAQLQMVSAAVFKDLQHHVKNAQMVGLQIASVTS
jgi:nitrogenase molybdenum-iron protein alpha/beta subunit